MTIENRIHKYLQPGRSWYKRHVAQIKVPVVHHTASVGEGSNDEILNNLAQGHWNRGWPGLAYHFMIMRDGRVYQLNEFTDITWTDSRNTDAVSICLHGYYHDPYNQKPTQAQLDSLKLLLDELSTKHPEFPADQDDVCAHRDRWATACCGDTLYPYVTEYREKRGVVAWTQTEVLPVKTDQSYPLHAYPRTIKVVGNKDLRVRVEPRLNDTNILKSRNLQPGSSFPVDGFTQGDKPEGTANNIWWKLKDEGLYVWSGGTDLIPAIPETQPEVVPVTIPEVVVAPVAPIEAPRGGAPIMYTQEQYNEALEAQRLALRQQAEMQGELTHLQGVCGGFKALGYASAEDVQKTMRQKDDIITGQKVELTQVMDRNKVLLDQLQKKDQEDYTAIEDSIKVMDDFRKATDQLSLIVRMLDTEPKIHKILNAIQSLKDAAKRAEPKPETPTIRNSDNLESVNPHEATGVFGFLKTMGILK